MEYWSDGFSDLLIFYPAILQHSITPIRLSQLTAAGFIEPASVLTLGGW
jgi:hypothetical protein